MYFLPCSLLPTFILSYIILVQNVVFIYLCPIIQSQRCDPEFLLYINRVLFFYHNTQSYPFLTKSLLHLKLNTELPLVIIHLYFPSSPILNTFPSGLVLDSPPSHIPSKPPSIIYVTGRFILLPRGPYNTYPFHLNLSRTVVTLWYRKKVYLENTCLCIYYPYNFTRYREKTSFSFFFF